MIQEAEPTDRLYKLLPAVYRTRDVAQGEPLRALMRVLERELLTIERDVEQLYDNWFIETCEEWVVPYLGDLLGVRGLLPAGGAFSQRGRVANTLAHRRGKGTGAALEQLARDITGWPARVVEYFQDLATTQHLNHIRPERQVTMSLRDLDGLELLGGPFERAARTADVRHVDNGRGRHNIPHLGIFLWRLQSYVVSRSTARALPDAAPTERGRYTFSPLGRDAPLFNRPRSEEGIAQLATETNVPGPLRRRPLKAELDTRRQAAVDGSSPRGAYFGAGAAESGTSVLEVWVQSTAEAPFEQVAPEEILICNLGDPPLPANPAEWRRPPATVTCAPADGGAPQALPIRLAVDPVLGRIAFPTGVVPHDVEVGFAYGFSGDLGGGPYNRRDSVAAWLGRQGQIDANRVWRRGVTRDARSLQDDQESASGQLVDTLVAAVRQWNAQPPGTFGVIAIMDSRTYTESLTGADAIRIPQDSRLLVVAADWPATRAPNASGPLREETGPLAADGRRPHLVGDLEVRGTAPGVAGEADAPNGLCLDGLLVEGSLTVLPGNLGELYLSHATLAPLRSTSPGRLTVAPAPAGTPAGERNERLEITLRRSITGPLRVADTARRLHLEECLVDGRTGGGVAVDAAPALSVESSTVVGATSARTLEASNSIFTEVVFIERRQTGCVRFSYLPLRSLAPRRYRCQPESASASGRVAPLFTSRIFGLPGYGQLAASCPEEIRARADDEGEMGVFHFLQQTQRVGSLRAALDEHLRFGLEAGTFFVT